MRNCDIVNAVFSRDKSRQLVNQINLYGQMREKGYRDFSGLERYRDLYEVLSRLSNWNYQVTEDDARILRKYNVLVSPLNSSNSTKNNKSFVAVSDFHGYNYPLDKIKKFYLDEYDVTFILGDATDRGMDGKGTGGIKLLIDIMNLSKQYPTKVVYIPGNHDEFLIGYVRNKRHMDSYYSCNYAASLIYNGGESTIRELNELEKQDSQTFNALISWLGKQPLQRVHNYNGKTYVLGHAIFNQRLYDMNPNYCLEDYFSEPKNSDSRRMARDVLWFRKEKDRYNMWEMPRSGKTMIIGHTIEKRIRGKNIDLCDGSGRTIKVHCVDGGIAYDGGMLKYDGGSSVIWTEMLQHNNTVISGNGDGFIGNANVIFQDYILDLVLRKGKVGFKEAMFGSCPRELDSEQVEKIVCCGYECKTAQEVEFMRSLYVKTFLFDYILECQIERMKERYGDLNNAIFATATLTDRFIHGANEPDSVSRYGSASGNCYNITSNRYARDIAAAMGPVAMEEVLRLHRCRTVNEYINYKFIKDEKVRAYTKNNPLYS